jgi:signal peptidase I
MKKKIRDGVVILAATFVAALFLKAFILEAFKIPSASMTPTLLPGDLLFINKFVYPLKLKSIHRGDIIAFRFSQENDQLLAKGTVLVKRCIGIPGDTIEMTNGVLKVNRLEFQKNYLKFDESMKPVVVPQYSLFVLGDNLDESYDSREWGFVPIDNVIGQAMIIYFSTNENGIRWNRIGKRIN